MDQIKKYAFDEIKWIVERDNLLGYTNFNEEFKTHTDARNFQLGAVIRHNEKSIAFYCSKLTGDHKRYTVT